MRHWLAPLTEVVGAASLPAATREPDPPRRPDEALLTAKALVFCGFPYKRTTAATIVREARLGADTHLTVHFSSSKLGVPIPFGADRALLSWITTLAYQSGWVSFDSLTSFFDAFHLGHSGAEYRRFEQRLERLLSLSLTLVLRTSSGEHHSNMPPLNDAFTPRKGAEARQLLTAENSPQLALVGSDLRRYGIVLNPKFHAYLREHPVALPLSYATLPLASSFLGCCLFSPLPLLRRSPTQPRLLATRSPPACQC